MKNFLWAFEGLLVLSVLIVPSVMKATDDSLDSRSGFGRIAVVEPTKDKEVLLNESLEVNWNLADPKISRGLSRLIGQKKFVYFRLWLIKEPTCFDSSTCPVEKYQLINGAKYVRDPDSSYSYKLAKFPSNLIAGDYRVAICYQTYAGQKISSLLARSRCGVGPVFVITDPSLGSDYPDSTDNYDEYSNNDDYLDYSLDNNDQSDFNQYQYEDNYYEEITVPEPVAGQCGLANGVASLSPPATNLCLVGATSTVEKVNDNWTWSCAGSDGGTKANCSAKVLAPLPPQIDTITSPVAVNGIVTIVGTGFTRSGNLISVGTILKTSISTSDGVSLRFSLLSRVPAGTYPLSVKNANGQSNIVDLVINPTSGTEASKIKLLANLFSALQKIWANF